MVDPYGPSALTLSGTQASGAASALVGRRFTGGHHLHHQIQVECVSTATGLPVVPLSGALAIRFRVPGAGQFAKIADTPLTAPSVQLIDGFFEAIEAESAGLDGGVAWRITMVSGD